MHIKIIITEEYNYIKKGNMTQLLKYRCCIQDTQKSVRVAITNALTFLEKDLKNVKAMAYTMSIITYAFVLDNKEARRTKDALSYFNDLATTTGNFCDNYLL